MLAVRTRTLSKWRSVCLLLFIVAPRFHVNQLENGSLPVGLDSYDVLFFLRPRFEQESAFFRLIVSALKPLRGSGLVLGICLLRWIRAIQNGPIFRQCFFVELRNLLRRVIRLHLYHRQLEAKRAAPDSHLNGPGVVLLVFVWFGPGINWQPHFLGGCLLAHHDSRSALILFPFHATRPCRSRWRLGRHANYAAKHSKKCKLAEGADSAARFNHVPIPCALFAHKTSLDFRDTRLSPPKFPPIPIPQRLRNIPSIPLELIV